MTATSDGRYRANNIANPAAGAIAVTPNDSTDLASQARALWIGTGGDVTVITVDGQTVLLANIPDGSLLPVRCTRVKSTGTTASDIVALY